MNVSSSSRRRFLRQGSGLLMGTLILGSPLAALAPSRTWALPLQVLDDHQSRTLLQMARTLYPHARLDDAAYALVVKALDRLAGENPQIKRRLVDGVAGLDRAAQGSWLKLDPAQRLAHIKAIEGTPLFETVRSNTVTYLYNNEMAFAYFGYGGPKGDGGYLYRGFNDLHWLPDPPVPGASGPMPPA